MNTNYWLEGAQLLVPFVLGLLSRSRPWPEPPLRPAPCPHGGRRAPIRSRRSGSRSARYACHARPEARRLALPAFVPVT